MSDLLTPATAADLAATAAGVRIRIVTELAELHEIFWLFDSIWHSAPAHAPVSRELLRAMSKAGNYVAGAFDETGLVGACAAFFAAPDRHEIHSHIAGVARAARGRNVGWALKLHQRAWALDHGMSRISWTYDPLVSRNAYFNLVKLGGAPVQYLPDFYGPMGDAINGDDATDRLLLQWDLTAPRVDQVARGERPQRWDAEMLRAAGAVTALGRTPSGEPVPGEADGRIVLVAVPPDIEALRRTDPAGARRWRVAVREALGPLIDGGARVTGFDRAGWYVVERTDA
ncbi:GNAT family N-acetyltransferase [Actinoplanes sp. TRM 88003]|uniref:GNAT family N-acetyltransferase n=1 Tax=Paractinoplanes aksuensis TaxID=2939490 RepID=A0ABT1DTE2_9ACTN|nr:GNAT family N-acetyltransferase [Actinoplanes aksuensis]MCO8274107.1 GNAT family N-acetyltransferase [Actinoplanes aksuensis]